jgi:triosephosphate isomerase
MLAKMAVTQVIVGHSERRQLFGETDDVVNKKTRAVLKAGMRPIVCVGETVDEREAGETENVVTRQLRGALARMGGESMDYVDIAYEPIWAIGTGRTAQPDDAGVIAETIRETLTELAGDQVAENARVLYGGSVNPANIKNFMAKTHIDGALVGGASLDPDEFAAIVRYWV